MERLTAADYQNDHPPNPRLHCPGHHRRLGLRRDTEDVPRRPVKTLSPQQWQAIQTIARKMRDRADSFNKPGARLEGMYERTHVEARQLGYGGDIHEWKALTRRILDP